MKRNITIGSLIILAVFVLYFAIVVASYNTLPQAYIETGSLTKLLLYLLVSMLYTIPWAVPAGVAVTYVVVRRCGHRALWITIIWVAVIAVHLLIPANPFRLYSIDGVRQSNVAAIGNILMDLRDKETVTIGGETAIEGESTYESGTGRLTLTEDVIHATWYRVNRFHQDHYVYYRYGSDTIPIIGGTGSTGTVNWDVWMTFSNNDELYASERKHEIVIYKHSRIPAEFGE